MNKHEETAKALKARLAELRTHLANVERSLHKPLPADASAPDTLVEFTEPGEYILLGGEPAEEPLLFGGPFVMDTPDNLQRAQRDFQNGIMGTLDGVPF